MKNRNFLIAIGIAGLLASQQAQALSLKLTTTGSANVNVTDGGAGDLTPLLGGEILYSGGIGAWSIDTEIATSKPLAGSAALPVLDLASFNATAALGPVNALHIWVTDTGFTGSPLGFLASISASLNTGVSAQFKTYADAANSAFGTGILLSNSGSLTAFFNDSQFAGPVVFGLPYSLTMEIILTSPVNKRVSFDASLAGASVPDGGLTVAFLGFAFVGIEGVRRKLIRK